VVWEFGRYRMDELIARGGMGEVYRAYDTEHDRVVAVKLLADHLAVDEDFRRRFNREARAAARLREPHVIPIHAYGEIDGHLYLDMRLVDGRDLSTTLAERGPMDPAAAVDVIAQVAGALDAAHADGLVHRDVKPSNVLVEPGGFAYLVDFGIARSMAPNADITGVGMPIGTVAYMAPERFRPDPVPIDHRADVYSLACLLFECLTGTAPFTGNALALMHAHLEQEPPRPTAYRRALPPAFDHVVAAGMAKDPDERFASAGVLAAAARHALTQPAPVPTPTEPTPRLQPRPTGRRGWLVGAIAVAMAALAAAAVVLLPRLGEDGTPTGVDQPSKTTTTTTTTPAPTANPDLALSKPLITPACDGKYIVIIGSAVHPRRYKADVQGFLDVYPNAQYLHAPSTGCQSLRPRTDDGADIYSVYLGPYAKRDVACARQLVVGGDSYIRRLDQTSTPDEGVSCG
jgi:serine/threonine protein kinase